MKIQFMTVCSAALLFGACTSKLAPVADNAVKPSIVTEQVPNDTDDPAFGLTQMIALK